MKPWDMFKRGVGCPSLFVALCFGFAIGCAVCAFINWATPYIDRQTATRHGLEDAQDDCR